MQIFFLCEQAALPEAGGVQVSREPDFESLAVSEPLANSPSGWRQNQPLRPGPSILENSHLLSSPAVPATSWGGCLSSLGQLSQNTTDWVAYRQPRFISHSFGVWEVQDQGAGGFSVP